MEAADAGRSGISPADETRLLLIVMLWLHCVGGAVDVDAVVVAPDASRPHISAPARRLPMLLLFLLMEVVGLEGGRRYGGPVLVPSCSPTLTEPLPTGVPFGWSRSDAVHRMVSTGDGSIACLLLMMLLLLVLLLLLIRLRLVPPCRMLLLLLLIEVIIRWPERVNTGTYFQPGDGRTLNRAGVAPGSAQ